MENMFTSLHLHASPHAAAGNCLNSCRGTFILSYYRWLVVTSVFALHGTYTHIYMDEWLNVCLVEADKWVVDNNRDI